MMNIQQKAYQAWNIGDSAQLSYTFTESNVLAFVELTGDENPLHRANATEKKNPALVPGAMLSSLAIGVVGSRLPGPGSILLRQEFAYHLPVYSGESIDMFLEIVQKEDRQKHVAIGVTCESEQHEKIMSGTIFVKLRK